MFHCLQKSNGILLCQGSSFFAVKQKLCIDLVCQEIFCQIGILLVSSMTREILPSGFGGKQTTTKGKQSKNFYQEAFFHLTCFQQQYYLSVIYISYT